MHILGLRHCDSCMRSQRLHDLWLKLFEDCLQRSDSYTRGKEMRQRKQS